MVEVTKNMLFISKDYAREWNHIFYNNFNSAVVYSLSPLGTSHEGLILIMLKVTTN